MGVFYNSQKDGWPKIKQIYYHKVVWQEVSAYNIYINSPAYRVVCWCVVVKRISRTRKKVKKHNIYHMSPDDCRLLVGKEDGGVKIHEQKTVKEHIINECKWVFKSSNNRYRYLKAK